MSSLRKIYRLILLAMLVVAGVVLSFIFLNRKKATDHINWMTVYWFHLNTRILGVRTQIFGTPLTQRTMYVSNHISWLDIPVIGQLTATHFLAKSEIEKWPVIGWLATKSGTLYLKRGHKHSTAEANKIMEETMSKGSNCLLFAEGTTTDGNIKKFHSRLIQSAIDSHAMIQPVAIFYPKIQIDDNTKSLDPNALFIGDTSMGESANLVLRAKQLYAEIHFLEPISSVGKTRDELAQYCFDKVARTVDKIKKPSNQ